MTSYSFSTIYTLVFSISFNLLPNIYSTDEDFSVARKRAMDTWFHANFLVHSRAPVELSSCAFLMRSTFVRTASLSLIATM